MKRERRSSRRIEKFPTPGQRFSDKFPTAGTYKMTIARKMPGGYLVTLGIDLAIKLRWWLRWWWWKKTKETWWWWWKKTIEISGGGGGEGGGKQYRRGGGGGGGGRGKAIEMRRSKNNGRKKLKNSFCGIKKS